MARSVPGGELEVRTRRVKLKIRRSPYYRTLEPGLSVAYHRPKDGSAGSWGARVMVSQAGEEPVRFKHGQLGLADDFQDADGEYVLSWSQAQAAAQRWAKGQTGKEPLTVAKACERYLIDLAARKGERAAGYARGRIRKHIESALGAKLVNKLTAGQLRSWHAGMVRGDDEGEERQRQSRDSANRVLAILRAALNLAFRDELVADDRAWRKVKPFKGVTASRKVILSPEDLQKLIDACEAGLQELVTAGALTGARLGELTSAEVRDLDVKAATLRITGKTGTREVHLNEGMLTLCRQMANGKKLDDHLFRTAEGVPWTESLHKRPFKEAVELSGVDPAATFYALRHAYISNALVAGVPAKAVADHCGTSLLMIQRNYAKLIVQDQKRYADMGAPKLRIGDDAGQRKVVPLKPTKAKAG